MFVRVIIGLPEERYGRGFKCHSTSAGKISNEDGLMWVEGPKQTSEVHQLCNALYCLIKKNTHKTNQTALRGALVFASDLLDPDSFQR